MVMEAYKNIIAERVTLYMLRQVLTIAGLFTAGLIPVFSLKKGAVSAKELILSFPLGLAVYSVLGFLLLILGIPFRIQNILIMYVVLIAGVFIYNKRVSDKGGSTYVNQPRNHSLKYIVTAYILVLLSAIIACSGLLSQTVTNDSVYYYSMYPSILVRDGYISANLDKYLTDVGQTTAIVQCLPFFLGFDESFGIQHFMNIDFVLFFFMALFESVKEATWGKRQALMLSLLGTVFLITSEPFVVLSKWILSNAWFMEYFFIVCYMALKNGEGEKKESRFAMLFLTAFLIMSRMEGGVLVFVLALALSVLNMEKKYALLLFGLPLCVMELGYYSMIYLKAGVSPLYSFLDIKTALLMTGLIIAYLVYIIFINEKLPQNYKGVGLLALLLSGNIVIMLINTERYLTNLKAFMLNIRQGNGWGSFIIAIVIYILILLYELVQRRLKDIPLSIFLPAAVALTMIAVCFARGGVLAVRTSDSGNRVLMEITPLLVFSVYTWIIKKIGEFN